MKRLLLGISNASVKKCLFAYIFHPWNLSSSSPAIERRNLSLMTIVPSSSLRNAIIFFHSILQSNSFLFRTACSSRSVSLPFPLMMSSNPRRDQGQRSNTPPPPINQYIKADTVRLIVPGNETDGEREEIMFGIVSLAEALQEAERYNLDLVMINDQGDPPVCKVIDYGKYKYSQEKKRKDNMKKQIKSEIKEVKMSYQIDTHDFDVRMRAVQKFLADGDRVKIIVQFKGREMQHKDLGRDLLMKVFEPLEGSAVVESTPKIEGRSMTMLVGPKKTK